MLLGLGKRKNKLAQNAIRTTSSQSGQGTLEYMLVLLITVIIILSIVYRFNTSFRVYAEAFFDGYIACLLETGEVPGVQASQCMDEFKDFDPKAGKAYLSGNLPGGQGGGGGASSDKGKQADQKKDSSAKGGKETVGSRSGSGSVGRISESGRFRTAVGSSSNAAATSSADQKDGNDSSSRLSSAQIGRVSGAAGGRNRTVIVYEGTVEGDQKKDEARKAEKVAKKDVSDDRLRPTKAIENGNRGPSGKSPEATGEFSIGALVRLFIIILIVVAMIIFFGGQLLQIARSQEKGGDG